jgi:multifunctional cyclase/dehydratase/O-methyltransferase
MRLISEAIYVVASLGISDLLTSGPGDSQQLAQTTGASPWHLRRVLRALSNFDIFSEDPGGRFVLTAMGSIPVPKSTYSKTGPYWVNPL